MWFSDQGWPIYKVNLGSHLGKHIVGVCPICLFHYSYSHSLVWKRRMERKCEGENSDNTGTPLRYHSLPCFFHCNVLPLFCQFQRDGEAQTGTSLVKAFGIPLQISGGVGLAQFITEKIGTLLTPQWDINNIFTWECNCICNNQLSCSETLYLHIGLCLTFKGLHT